MTNFSKADYLFCVQENDPFYEPPDSQMLIGAVHMHLRSLAHMIELDDQLPITDFKVCLS